MWASAPVAGRFAPRCHSDQSRTPSEAEGDGARGTRCSLAAPGGWPVLPRSILLLKRLPDQCLDHRLPADIQLFRSSVQFFKHSRSQVNVDPLDRPHHPSRIGEERRNILPLVRSRAMLSAGTGLRVLRVLFIKLPLLPRSTVEERRFSAA
jgi:hypothetical protein